MENLNDDSENNAKVSDSAYSNSCSNSQSRRSHSSKSTHSGSSGSSGYGGKQSTSGSSTAVRQQREKRTKDKKSKNLKPPKAEIYESTNDLGITPRVENNKVDEATTKQDNVVVMEKDVVLDKVEVEFMNVATDTNNVNDESNDLKVANYHPVQNFIRPHTTTNGDGFSCVISMQDGVVMYTSTSLSLVLGFPKDSWIGRSFIDFVHPTDRSLFATEITSRLASPKNEEGVRKVVPINDSVTKLICRFRNYRGLSNTGFSVKDRSMTYTPLLLKLTFKNISDEEGKATYLVIHASSLFSAYKAPNHKIVKPIPFTMRHIDNGNIEFTDVESVPYLGYIPQDLKDENIINLYHPDDLVYLKQVYDAIIKEGGVPRSKPYRIMTQNGDYAKVETEWSSFVNPWTRKLEFIIGKHYTVEGPTNPDIFQTFDHMGKNNFKRTEDERNRIQGLRNSIIDIMKEAVMRPAEIMKQQMNKCCQDFASFMESLMEETGKPSEELRYETNEGDPSYYCERDSVMLGGISPHHDNNDSKSSTETPLSYNQLNYNENLQRYFDSYEPSQGLQENLTESDEVCNRNQTICLSPIAQLCGDSAEGISLGDSLPVTACSSPDLVYCDCAPIKLTESLLNKHNADMEKDLAKKAREGRTSSRVDKEKKKKDHLSKCKINQRNSCLQTPKTQNFQNQRHGVKRNSRQLESENQTRKHYKASPQHTRQVKTTQASAQEMSPTLTPSIGMYPMYYMRAPHTITSQDPTINDTNALISTPVQYMMHPQPVFGPQFLYSSLNPQVTFSLMNPPFIAQQQAQFPNSSLSVPNSNYKDYVSTWTGPQQSLPLRSLQPIKNKLEQMPSTFLLNRRSEATASTDTDEKMARTDGESSLSSFYSSFFKTETSSTDDGFDPRQKDNKDKLHKRRSFQDVEMFHEATTSYVGQQTKRLPQKKMEPPWMEEVQVTSELIYKYQIVTKGMQEVLDNDKKKFSTLEQPSLVNEQLGQLYVDLQLEGVAARLTLEEGMTSSGSSSEESSARRNTIPKRKKVYSRLGLMYEEDAPLPSPPVEAQTI